MANYNFVGISLSGSSRNLPLPIIDNSVGYNIIAAAKANATQDLPCPFTMKMEKCTYMTFWT